jgi:hypothetical protein
MSKKTGGRPRKTKGLIDVARWMPQIRRVCSRQLVLNQLDDLLEGHAEDPNDKGSLLAKRITQIKKDVTRIQL